MTLLDMARGRTFDDFLFAPQLGIIPSRDPNAIDLSTRFSEHLTLSRPIVSANMDTITRSAMAVVLAEEGGIGVIDRGFRAGSGAQSVFSYVPNTRSHQSTPMPKFVRHCR